MGFGLIRALVACLLIAGCWALEAPAALRGEYTTLVEQADLAVHPERHRTLAEWCQRQRWQAGHQYHTKAFHAHEFDRKLAAVGDDAGVREFRSLYTLAQRLGLDEQAQDMHGRLMQAEVTARRGKLAAEDADGLAAILDWAQKEGATAALIEELARAVLVHDPAHAHAHRALGHIPDAAGQWLDPWQTLVERGGLTDVKVRYQIHTMVAEARGPQKVNLPPDPFAGYTEVPAPLLGGKVRIWEGPIQGQGDGQGQQFLWAPRNYHPRQAWPLLVYLHGGGGGGLDSARQSAGNNLGAWTMQAEAASYVMIAPLVRKHVMSAWTLQENQLDVIDATIDACRRFNIDRSRIYLAGYSMGGGGVGRLAWMVPECFAAFSPQAGGYTNRFTVPDLAGKGFFVVHGAKDSACPVSLAHEFIAKSRAAGAQVEYVEYPDAGHALSFDAYLPQMFAFLAERRNPIIPDLDLVRRVLAGP